MLWDAASLHSSCAGAQKKHLDSSHRDRQARRDTHGRITPTHTRHNTAARTDTHRRAQTHADTHTDTDTHRHTQTATSNTAARRARLGTRAPRNTDTHEQTHACTHASPHKRAHRPKTHTHSNATRAHVLRSRGHTYPCNTEVTHRRARTHFRCHRQGSCGFDVLLPPRGVPRSPPGCRPKCLR